MDRPIDPSIRATLDRAEGLLVRGQRCIVNTDIDGLLTATLLQQALDWEVIGFYDSKDSLYIREEDIGHLPSAVFVDVFIAPGDFKCIDQHIVALDEEHAHSIAENPAKLNPNIQRVRYASRAPKDPRSYPWKYPFGSFHFILACLEGLGIDPGIHLRDSYSDGVSVVDLILRADDAARTTSKNYIVNARDWWGWLTMLGGEVTARIASEALSASASHAQDAYERLSVIFRKRFSCHTNDGNFSKALKQGDGAMSPWMLEYIHSVGEAMGVSPARVPDRHSVLKGIFDVCPSYDRETVSRIIGRKDLFSYAVTYLMGPLAAKGFSYTLWPPDGRPDRVVWPRQRGLALQSKQ